MFEIGSSLREARLRQGLDFPRSRRDEDPRQVPARARGRAVRPLPAQTYVKGFLRTYAEYLGLDGQLYVDEFNSRYVVAEEEPPIRARRTARPHVRKRVAGNVLIAALVGIALVTALVIAAWNSRLAAAARRSARRSRPPKHKATRLAADLGREHHDSRPALGCARARPQERRRPGRCSSDQELSAGQTKHFTSKRLWINTGTPENLRITVNGKRVTIPGGAAAGLRGHERAASPRLRVATSS